MNLHYSITTILFSIFACHYISCLAQETKEKSTKAQLVTPINSRAELEQLKKENRLMFVKIYDSGNPECEELKCREINLLYKKVIKHMKKDGYNLKYFKYDIKDEDERFIESLNINFNPTFILFSNYATLKPKNHYDYYQEPLHYVFNELFTREFMVNFLKKETENKMWNMTLPEFKYIFEKNEIQRKDYLVVFIANVHSNILVQLQSLCIAYGVRDPLFTEDPEMRNYFSNKTFDPLHERDQKNPDDTDTAYAVVYKLDHQGDKMVKSIDDYIHLWEINDNFLYQYPDFVYDIVVRPHLTSIVKYIAFRTEKLMQRSKPVLIYVHGYEKRYDSPFESNFNTLEKTFRENYNDPKYQNISVYYVQYRDSDFLSLFDEVFLLPEIDGWEFLEREMINAEFKNKRTKKNLSINDYLMFIYTDHTTDTMLRYKVTLASKSEKKLTKEKIEDYVERFYKGDLPRILRSEDESKASFNHGIHKLVGNSIDNTLKMYQYIVLGLCTDKQGKCDAFRERLINIATMLDSPKFKEEIVVAEIDPYLNELQSNLKIAVLPCLFIISKNSNSISGYNHVEFPLNKKLTTKNIKEFISKNIPKISLEELTLPGRDENLIEEMEDKFPIKPENYDDDNLKNIEIKHKEILDKKDKLRKEELANEYKRLQELQKAQEDVQEEQMKQEL